MQSAVLALSEDKILPVSAVLNAIRGLGDEAVEQCDPQIITQASSLSTIFNPTCVSFFICDIGFHRFCYFSSIAFCQWCSYACNVCAHANI